jgi:hypothetical protein
VAKFEFFLLNDDFDKLFRDEFFQSHEVLKGKTICDLCLNYPKEIATALRLNSEEQIKSIQGSLMYEICKTKKTLIKAYQKLDYCEENLVIQIDFNFMTTLRVGIELNSNQSIKILIRNIFVENTKDYQNLMMLDLPILLKQNRI